MLFQFLVRGAYIFPAVSCLRRAENVGRRPIVTSYRLDVFHFEDTSPSVVVRKGAV